MPELKRYLYSQTCRPRIVVAWSSEGNPIYVSKPHFEAKNKISTRADFCVYTCATNSNVSDVSKKKKEKKQIFCASVNAALRPFLGPYDFRDAEKADGIAESSHKNGIYSLTRNVTESESLHEHFTISFE